MATQNGVRFWDSMFTTGQHGVSPTNNAVLGCAMIAMAEGFALVRKYGVEPRDVAPGSTAPRASGGGTTRTPWVLTHVLPEAKIPCPQTLECGAIGSDNVGVDRLSGRDQPGVVLA